MLVRSDNPVDLAMRHQLKEVNRMNEIVRKMVSEYKLDPIEFEQHQVVNLIRHPLSDVWTTVYTYSDEIVGTPAIFCCFADKERDMRANEQAA